MQNKKRSLRLALLLSLIGFIALVYVASQDHRYQGGDMSAKITYGLDLQLKWIATDANADFAVVQDTLSFYAAALDKGGAVHSTRYRLDHCCEDMVLRAAFTGGADFYHLDLSTDFVSEGGRDALLAYLHDQDMLQVHGSDATDGNLNGNADFTLAVPNQPGKFLQIQGSQFELSFVPRFAHEVDGEPMA